MYVGKSPIGNRSVSDLAIWGAPASCVCVCVLMLAQWDKGGRRCSAVSGGQWQKVYLVRIVGTGDEAEETGERVPVRPGDLPDLTAGRSEVPEEEVDGEVPQLAGSEGRQAGVDLGGGGARVERVVHVVTHVGSKPPIVSAVL